MKKKAGKKAKNKKEDILSEALHVQKEDFEKTEDISPEEKKKKKIRKIIGIVAFVIFNAIVLFFTARDQFSQTTPKFQGEPFGIKNVMFLLGGILCVVVVLGIETIKYVLMMRHLGEKVSVRAAFETAALGKYYDCITPSGAGGQPFQIWHLHSKGYSNGASSAMPLTGFVTMQYGFVFLCAFVFIFNNGAISSVPLKIAAYVGMFTYSIVPTMIILTAVSPSTSAKMINFFVNLGAKIRIIKKPDQVKTKVENSLNDYAECLRKIEKNKGLLVSLFVLSFILQVAMCSIPYFVIHTFGGDLGFIQSLSMCTFVMASVTIVPTPGNSGAAEGSFYLLFNKLDTFGLFWSMLVWRALCYYSFIIIGVIIYLYGAVEKIVKLRKEKKSESE